MSRPATLLEGLCGHALGLGAHSLEVEYRDREEWVFARKGDTAIRIAHYRSTGADAKELRDNLYAAAKRPVRTVLNGARSFTEQHMITLAKFFNVGHGIILSGGRGERREVRHG